MCGHLCAGISHLNFNTYCIVCTVCSEEDQLWFSFAVTLVDALF